MKLQFRLQDIGRQLRLFLWIIPGNWIRSMWSGLGLRLAGEGAGFDRRGTVVAVSPYFGNPALIPAFLNHHRHLGVDQFVFLDLSRDGDLWALLQVESDCAVWRPRKWRLNQAVQPWLNFLRWRYATGQWCLSVDASDLFVFYRSETRRIKDLADFLEGERRFHVYSVIVEMYARLPAASIRLGDGEDPLAKLSLFDGYGYSAKRGGEPPEISTSGGLQRRTLFSETPDVSPLLNRVPFLKWKWYYSYCVDTRLLTLPSLHAPHGRWHSVPTGCLLRFALLDDNDTLATASRAEVAGAPRDGRPLSYAGIAKLRVWDLKREISVQFRSSEDLLKCGLLNPGQWF